MRNRYAMPTLLLLLAGTANAADPIEGRWLGLIGTPLERVEAGVEFKRADDGTLHAYFTNPILNLYGSDVGEAKVEGSKVTNAPLYLELELKDDKLVGFFPGPRSPTELRRVAKLPVEAPVPTLATGPGPRWSTRLNGQAFGSPVAFGDMVYVGTSGAVMNAVDAKDGTIKWTYAAAGPIHGTAAVTEDAVYFTCDDGLLRKLARADGKELWTHEMGDAGVRRVLPHPTVFEWDYAGSTPTVAGDVVYAGGANGEMHAVDAATGALKWRFATGGKIRTGALVDGDRLVFGGDDKLLYALDRATGRELWRFDMQGEVTATPIAFDGAIIVGNRGPGLYSIDAEKGTQNWRLYFWGSWVESTAVIHDGTLYVGSSDLRRVSAIDPATGAIKWRSDVYGSTWGTPLVLGNRVYAGAIGEAPYAIRHVGGFVTLDRATGKALSRYPLPDAGNFQWGVAGSPVAAGGGIVVATIGGALLSFAP